MTAARIRRTFIWIVLGSSQLFWVADSALEQLRGVEKKDGDGCEGRPSNDGDPCWDVFCRGFHAGNANLERRGGNLRREAADGVGQPEARGCRGQQRQAPQQRDSSDPVQRSKRYEHYCGTRRGKR